MKKLLTVVVALAMMMNTSFAAFTESKTENKQTQSKNRTISTEEKKMAAEFFTHLSRKDYEQLSGRHLNLAERLAFKIAQKQAKNALKREAETEGFNLGGFALGFLLGLIGVLLGYIFSRDSNLHKWSWIGFGAYVVILLIILAIAA